MNRRIGTSVLALGLWAALYATPADAALGRVVVSAKNGADSGACGAQATPCQTFQTAHDNAAAGGVIVVADPGDYGPVTITKSISIVNDGVGTAGVLSIPSSGPAIAIDVPAGQFVSLRGLTLEGSYGAGNFGVWLKTSGSVTISNCIVRNFGGGGIWIAPTATGASFLVTDTLMTGNSSGFRVFPSWQVPVSGALKRVRAVGNRFGVEVINAEATLSDSVVSNNSDWGVIVQGSTGAPGVLSARNVVASNNGPGTGDSYTGSGFLATSGLLRLAHSVATGNQFGVTVNGGAIESYGDNDLVGNVGASVNYTGAPGGGFTTVGNQ